MLKVKDLIANKLAIIICLSVALISIYSLTYFFSIQNLPVEKVAIKVNGKEVKEISIQDIMSEFAPDLIGNDYDAVNNTISKIALITNFTFLVGAAIFCFFSAKLIIAILEISGNFSLGLRCMWLNFSHSWIEKYGFCRSGDLGLEKHYYKLLKIVSKGFPELYKNENRVFLTFDGTVTDLIMRYKDDEQLRKTFQIWRELSNNGSDVTRVIAPPPHEWKLIDEELEKISLDIYKLVAGSTTTFWTHSQNKIALKEIKALKKLSPGLDYALFMGKERQGDTFPEKACVGYIEDRLVYKLLNSDIQEQEDYFSEIKDRCHRNHEALMTEIRETKKGNRIAAYIKFKNKFSLRKQKNINNRRRLIEDLKELYIEEHLKAEATRKIGS